MAVYYLDENQKKLKKIKDNQYLYDDDIDYNNNNVNINYNINKSKYEEAKANNDFIQSKLDTTAKKYIEQEKLSNNDIVNEILSSEDYKKPLTTLDKRNLTTTVNSFYNDQRETTSGRNTIQSKKNELFKDKNLTVEEQNKIINLIVKNPKWSERYKNIIEENGVNALSDAEAMLKNEKVLANYQENVLKQPLKKTNVIEQIFTPITSGINSILTGMDTSSNRYVDEKGKTHFLPTESDLDLQRVNQSYGKGALGVAGKVYSAVANSGSKILTSAGINTFTAGIGGSSAYFGSIIGNSYKEAINNGATNDKAILNGLSKAGLEYVTGRILGSTTSALTSQFTGKATSELGGAISNKLYKLMGRWPGLANAIGSGISEGLEEFIQTPIEHAIDLFTIGKDGKNTNLGDLIKDSDIWAEAMFSGVVGGLTGGLLSPLNSTAKQIKSLEVFRNLLTEDINEIKQNKNYDQTKVNKLETLIKSLDEKLNTPFTLENNDWNNLGQEIQEYSQEKNKISVNPLLNNDSIILPKNNGPINTETNDGNIINDSLNINGENISLQDNNFIDSANRNNIDTTSRDFNLINQFLSNRGLEARFDTNMFNNNEENALYGISEQGQRYVIFNPNSTSNQRIQSIAVHEVYHDLVNSGISSEIENIILKNASTKQDFDKAFDNLKEIYSTAGYDINDINFNNLIKEEATASILGQKLGNNEFIESVIKYDKNIFTKLHNIVLSIVNFLNKLRGYKDEKLLWKEIANKYTEYYKNNFKLNEISNATLENKNNVMKSITANDDIDIEDTFKKLTKNDDINSSEIEDTIYKLIEDNSYDIENKSHALLDIDKIAKEKNFNISTSPYSFSIYAIPKNDKVDWNYKPKDSYRLSDHWNFFSDGEVHCKLTNVDEYTHGLILAKYNGKTYDIVKDYRNSQNLEEKYQEQIDDYIYKNSYKEQQWGKAKENTIELFKYEANKWYESEKKALENQIKTSLEDENTDSVNFSQEELEYFNDTFENGKNLTPTTIKDYIDSKYDEVDYNLDFSLELLMEDLKRYNVEDKELTNHLENNEEKLKKQNELHKSSFSSDNERYSISPVKNNKTLMAIHNLTVDKLKGVLELGGFPVPSIAITNPTKVDHNQYGNISVIFDKATIDPINKKNEVYDRDVWSPTFPQVDYNLDSTNLKQVSAELGIKSYELEDYAENNKTPEYLSDRLTRDEKIVDKYVKENNIKYKEAYKKPDMRVAFHTLSGDIQKFIIDNDFDVNKLVNSQELRQQYFDLIKKYYNDSDLPSVAKEHFYNEEKNQLNNFIEHQINADSTGQDIVRELIRYDEDFKKIKSGVSEELDEWQTQKNKREAAIENGLKEYLIKETKPLFAEKGIYNGKDYLTPSGNRRSFWQLHDEYNLENIVDNLTSQDTKGTQNWVAGYGQIQAQLANRFNSIEEIKRNESNLTDLSQENERLNQLRYEIKSDLDGIVDNNDVELSTVSELVADFAKGELTTENFRELTDKYYQTSRNVTDEQINKLIKDLKELKNMPTDYFEAKPQRAVGIDEIKAIVIPNDTDSQLKKELANRGLKVVEYNPKVENDKQNKINSLDDLKFSKKTTTWQEFLDKNYTSTGKGKTMKEIRESALVNFGKNLDNYKEDDIQNQTQEELNNDSSFSNDFEERLYNKTKEKIIKRYENKRKEIVKGLTKNASNFLEFDSYERKNYFKKIVEQYYDNPEITVNDIKEDIKEEFGTRTIESIEDSINDVRRWIRTTDLKIDNNLKSNIANYNEFRKSNFNKLKLKDSGTDINTFYQEISLKYPEIFDSKINEEKDQLYYLSEFMNHKYDYKIKEPLYEEEIEAAAQFIYDEVSNHTQIDDLIDSISLSRQQIRRERVIEYREKASELIANSDNWKDKKYGIQGKLSTMKRNFYDVMGKNDGERIYQYAIQPIFKHNSDMQKEITKYNNKINALQLDNKDSVAVQMLGEYKYNPSTNLTGDQVNSYIEKNKLDYDKITNAVEVMRNVYDELLPKVNEVMKSQGMKEIPYRKGYFPHFMDEHFDSKLGRGLELLGWKAKNNDIPTDIAGITESFTPSKVYANFAQQRKGKVTDYNALKGFDKYVRGAMELIYFTEDIQKLRALENQIRYEHSPKNIQEQIDEIYDDSSYSSEERQEALDKVWEKARTPLNNLVSNLRDYTNMIANKKSVLDRTMENLVGRKYYGLMQNVSNRLSANMVGANIGSSLTNFIPVFRATSQVKTKYILKGIAQSINNLIKNDGFDDKSVFLTTRLNSADVLYKTKLDKISEKANFMFEGIDSISSNIVVRSKYLQNIAEGMSEFQAMRNADEFGRDLMAGRSKGEMPTLFNSKNPLIKIFTAFQLEVNNDFQYMLKDIPRDMKDKTKKALVSAFVKMFIASWIYNQITKKIMGRETTVEPISKISNTYNTLTNINLTGKQKQSQITKDLLQEAPFIGGLLGGGRLPTNSLADPMKIVRGESTVGKEAKNLLYYTLLPFGGGQLKKIQDGSSMYINNKQIKGKYNNKGDLLYEAKKDPVSISKNILFGQYSTDEAREYFENGYSPINKTNQKKIIDSNISVSEYRKIKNIDKNINRIIKSDKHNNGISIKDNENAKKVFELMNKPYNKKEINFLLKEYDKTNQPIDLEVLNQIPKTLENYKLYFNMSRANREKFVEDIKENNISVEDLINYYNKIKDLSKDNLPRDMYEEQRLEYIKNTPLKNEEKWLLYFKENSNNNIDKYNLKYDDYYNVTKLNKELKNMKNPNRKSIMFNYINNLKYNKLIKQNLFSIIGYGGKK